MTYVMGNATVPASSTVPVFTVPPGLCAVTFYNTNPAATNVYVGTSSAGTNVNGLVCHSIPVNFTTFPGSRGAQFWATTGGATPSSVNFITVTAQ